jgi:hypothetical protein
VDADGRQVKVTYKQCLDLAIKSQPVPQFVRPKLDVEHFVKLGDRIAAGHGRELCAHWSHCGSPNRSLLIDIHYEQHIEMTSAKDVRSSDKQQL